MEGLLDRKEAARLLNCSTKTVDRLRERGELGWVPVGRTVKFRPQALEEYITANERNRDVGERVTTSEPRRERQLTPERIHRSGRRTFVPPALRQLRDRRNQHGQADEG